MYNDYLLFYLHLQIHVQQLGVVHVTSRLYMCFYNMSQNCTMAVVISVLAVVVLDVAGTAAKKKYWHSSTQFIGGGGQHRPEYK